MSILAIQLGQCGNQIGREVFDTICTDLHSSQGFCSRKENDAYQAVWLLAVLVDMEPKVINQTLSFLKNWELRYGPQSAFCQKQGSGNNWAHGYCAHGGFLMIMSMAGGTGSGLGAFVTAALREAYPNSFLLNHVIWPYGTGEVIVQNYNSVLTLSHLYQSSDALLVHENAVHKICLQLMKIKQLGSAFQPPTPPEGAHYSRSPLAELLQLRNLFKPAVNFNTSIANLVTLRGKEVQCADLSNFQDPALYTSWLNPPETLRIWNTPRAFNKYEKSASLVSNSQFLLSPLNSLVGKAWKMFASKAYIHQYSKFGIEEDDFLGCFTTLEQVIASYSSL
uniref:Tubulin/FtsZ GTPase domain-containing protein n=1 Tax=Naja naja TaxID=35670 RepID=A0A8C7DTZ1_NAJNA